MTQNKTAEAHKSDDLYRIIVEAIPQKIFTKDKNSVYLSCNTRYAVDLNINPDDIIGKTDYDFFPHKLAEKYRSDDKQVMISGRTHEITEEYQLNGKKYWINTSKTPLRDADGNCIGIFGIFKDITQQRDAEEALCESERRYRLLYYNMRDAYAQIDMAGKFTEFNDAFVQLIQYEPYEIYSLTHYDITPKQWHDIEMDIIQNQVLTRGFSDLYETEYQRKDGFIVPVELRTHLIKNEIGNPCGIWTIIRDITKRREIEKQLFTSEIRFRELFGVISSGVVVYDVKNNGAEFIFKDINPAGSKILGLKKDNVIGYSLDILFPELDSTGFPVALQRVWRTGIPEPFQIAYHPNGLKTVWTDNYIYPLATDEIVVVFNNITVQKENEDTIREANVYNRNLLEANLDPFVTIGPDGIIHDVNEATVQITGYSREQLIGTNFSDYFTEPKKAIKGYEKVFMDGIITDYELHIHHKDGHITPVLYNATVLRDNNGTITEILAVARDITERKRIEALLIRFNEKLESGIREKTLEMATLNKTLQEEISQRMLAENTIRNTLSLLNAAIESTADGILVVDYEGNITTFNRKFTDLWKIEWSVSGQYTHLQIVELIAVQLKDPVEYLSCVQELNEHPERERFDMLALKDGRMIERYSIPQMIDDVTVGRVWSYRDVTQRRRAEKQIIASLDEKEVLLREIHHRVKNNLQLISSLLDMTRMRTEDPGTSSILTDVMMKIKTMSQIHTRLYESTQFDKIAMKTQICDQITAISQIYTPQNCDITCTVQASELYLPVDQAIPCALVINEIISNSYKHAFKGEENGEITILFYQEDNSICIIVSDNGIGIKSDFDISLANSLGLKLVRNLVEQQLKGTLTLNRKEGTEVIVTFPILIL